MSENDSSFEDDESQGDEMGHGAQSNHHQSASAFTSRFNSITKQFPSAFKKAVSRERITTNTNDDVQDYHHHEKVSNIKPYTSYISVYIMNIPQKQNK